MTDAPLADLHSHVLPGVDDGAPDLEAALATLEALQRDGVRAVCATPHLRASAAPNGDQRTRANEAWGELTAAAAGRLHGLELYRGFEILLDTKVFDFSDPELRLGGTGYVLVEWSAFTIPPDSVAVVDSLTAAGVRPVIAHAERYFGYQGRYDVVGAWREAGAVIQVNSGSVVRGHGEGAARQAAALLERGWVDLLASDTHARPNRSPSVREAYDGLVAGGAREHAELLLWVNPRRILQDEPTIPVPRFDRRRGLASRLFAWAARGRRRKIGGSG